MSDERLAALDDVFASNQSYLEGLLEFDRKTYLPALIVRLDKMTMAGAIEARVPFLDFRLVQWSKSVPPADKVALGRENKVLLKRLAAASFPRDMVYRRKVGFGVPVAEWLRDTQSLGRFADVLNDTTFRQRSYCNPPIVSQLLSDHLAGRRDHAAVLWPLLNVELWWRRFFGGVNQP
jgi:asparagine synthase (glutamine-hydrolysing)